MKVPRYSGVRWTPQLASKAERLKAKGLTYDQIGPQLDVPPMLLRHFLGADFGPNDMREVLW